LELLELRRQFERAVAPLEIAGPRSANARRGIVQPGQFALDVRDGKDEAFVLRLGDGADERWRFLVTNAEPARSHLLFVAKRCETTDAPADAARHFLCGRDERHLFVAGLTLRVPTVAAAKASLKPEAVVESEAQHRVGAKARDRRRNRGFVRQGEWFFLPRPEFVPPEPRLVQHREPIRRGSGKAHIVEHLYREGSGERVWVCSQFPQGVGEQRYRELVKGNSVASRWDWRAMVRTTQVFARGRVRHPDHATVYLPFWHQIVPNAEAEVGSTIRQSVAFLD
jgi:hypothetical protein